MQKLMTWASICAAAAFLLIWFWSDGQSMTVRITTSMLVSGGGFIAGLLVALVFLEKDDHEENHEESHSGT